MIQRSPRRQDSVGIRRTPSVTEIARKRDQIQATWSLDERRRRAPVKRNEQRDVTIQAHLRFIEFLISHNDSQNGPHAQDAVRSRRRA